MIETKRDKSLSGSFMFASLAYGVIVFFVVLVWCLPERAQVIAHFRVYMLPTILFGLAGRVLYDSSGRYAEKVGKVLMAMGGLSCGAFIGLFIHTFMTGK